MEEQVFGTTIGTLRELSQGSIPHFPTKNQGESTALRSTRVSGSSLGFPGCRIGAKDAVPHVEKEATLTENP